MTLHISSFIINLTFAGLLFGILGVFGGSILHNLFSSVRFRNEQYNFWNKFTVISGIVGFALGIIASLSSHGYIIFVFE